MNLRRLITILLFSTLGTGLAFAEGSTFPIESGTLVGPLQSPKADIIVVEVSSDTYSEYTKIQNQTELECVQKQIKEVLKVSDLAGSKSELEAKLKAKKINFRIEMWNTQSGDPHNYAPGHSVEKVGGIAEGTGIFENLLIKSRLYIDKKSHTVTCDIPNAQEVYDYLINKEDGFGLTFSAPSTALPKAQSTR